MNGKQLDQEAMLGNIIACITCMDRYKDYEATVDDDGVIFFHNINDKPVIRFNAREVLKAVVDYIQATGSDEVEVRQNGITLFAVKAIY